MSAAAPAMIHLYAGPLDGKDIPAPGNGAERLRLHDVDAPKGAQPVIYVACAATSELLRRPCYRHAETRAPGRQHV